MEQKEKANIIKTAEGKIKGITHGYSNQYKPSQLDTGVGWVGEG